MMIRIIRVLRLMSTQKSERMAAHQISQERMGNAPKTGTGYYRGLSNCLYYCRGSLFYKYSKVSPPKKIILVYLVFGPIQHKRVGKTPQTSSRKP